MTFTSSRYLLGLFLLCATACSYYNYDDMSQISEHLTECYTEYMTYDEDIIYLFQTACVTCHQADNAQGGVTLDDYGQVMAHVNDSSLLRSIESVPGYTPMPPEGTSWSACNTDKVRAWIEDGAYKD